jgi:hypothetical protein
MILKSDAFILRLFSPYLTVGYVSRIEKRAIKKLSKAFHYNTKKNMEDKKDG